MSTETIKAYEAERERLTCNQIFQKLVLESSIKLTYTQDWTGAPESVAMKLNGAIAALPSIKNSKQMIGDKDKEGNGRLIISNEYRARLKALDFLYKEAVFKATCKLNARLTFGKAPVWVTLICGNRKVRFDADNCFGSVQDWLEPNEKGVKNKTKKRGWGVGLIDDDSQITGLCIKAKDLGWTTTSSFIFVERLERKREDLLTFLSSTLTVASNWN